MFGIKFTVAADALVAANSSVVITEAHGCLCGALCATEDYPLTDWLDELFDASFQQADNSESAIVRDHLHLLHTDTVRALRSEDMEFAPFLPEDDQPLARRADALAQWCQGFLYGFGSVGNERRPDLSTEATEILRDLAAIGRASAGETEPTEEDESDYAEIVEYVRVSVQLVYDELAPHRATHRLQ